MASPDYLPDWADNVTGPDVAPSKTDVSRKSAAEEVAKEIIDPKEELEKLATAGKTIKKFFDPEFLNKLIAVGMTSEQVDKLWRHYDMLRIAGPTTDLLHGRFIDSNKKVGTIDVKDFRKRLKGKF